MIFKTKYLLFQTNLFYYNLFDQKKNFNFKGKTICFEIGLKAKFYMIVKDVLKETSTLKSSTDLFDKFAKELTGYVNID